MDFWNEVQYDLNPILTDLSPSQLEVLSVLKNYGIHYDIVSNNLQSLIDDQIEDSLIKSSLYKPFDFDATYHTYDEIVAELQSIATNQTTGKTIYNK